MVRSLWLRTALAAAFTVVSFTTASAVAQDGLGAPYGTRNARRCEGMKDPVKGAPSVAQAAMYVACTQEKETSGNTLYLIDNLKVEIGKGIPYRDIPEIHRPGNADPAGIVYSIRGSFRKYMCSKVATTGMFANVGKSCRVYEQEHATGSCFRTDFGEWFCDMYDLNAGYGIADQPPPPK
jgi:hypothetical protein